MTYSALYALYFAWTDGLGVTPKENIEQNLLCTRTVEDTPSRFTMESFHAEGVYTDRLHLFVFSVYTTAEKARNGDLLPAVLADYTHLEST